MIQEIQQHLSAIADAEDAAFLQRYFKTGAGQYGEGDIFRGIRVPALRKVATSHKNLPLPQVEELLHSPYHEDRLLALLILVAKVTKGDETLRQEIYDLYLRNTRYINNWDLVDASAPYVVGQYLWDKEHERLDQLAGSENLWERRIAILATFYFIRFNKFDTSLKIAERLVSDKEDLIHKAVGWMLREVGKRNQAMEEEFLRTHCKKMPRTMLRYAIERFPEEKRKKYLTRR